MKKKWSRLAILEDNQQLLKQMKIVLKSIWVLKLIISSYWKSLWFYLLSRYDDDDDITEHAIAAVDATADDVITKYKY